ncbi:MAG: EAL domain-containing protein [Methylococcales bacterium]|nr:EAL domain-containing protein [Methylococcales bacterium]
MDVLLLEDNRADAVLIQQLLAEQDSAYQVCHCTSLEQAEVALSRQDFQVALLDLSLPDAFGTALFERIDCLAPDMPIIVLTGCDDQALAMRLAEAGAQDYLVKNELTAGLLVRTLHYARERKRVSVKLQLAAAVFDSTLEGILITDTKRRIISANEAFCQMSGFTLDALLGLTPRLFDSKRHSRAFFRQMWIDINRDGQWRGEIWNRRKNGEVFPCWVNISAVQHPVQAKVTNYVAIFTEITELKLSQEKLDHLAHHDPLTGLPNRLLFKDRMEQALRQALRQKTIIAVMFLDLDRFKLINDTLGHWVGDELLRAVADRLRHCVRDTDTIARLGGDEFAIILANMRHEAGVEKVAQKIIKALAAIFCVGGHEVFVTTSIGITLYPDVNSDRKKLLENADVAMYQAKAQGRNTYQFYTQEMNAAAFHRLRLETQLRTALERGEFRLFYQPQIDLESGEAMGVEALLRWQTPEFGLVSPGEFIPMLEETGLIIPVGEWVINTACEQLHAWLEDGLPSITMAVNLSARQFREPDLLAKIQSALQRYQVPPKLLELELTESMVMDDVEGAVAILQKLKAIGVKVAIDDFGTGVSSLGALKQFPVDTLKISHDFVLNLPEDAVDASIASAVIGLARNMSLGSVAEGVETAQQLDFLRGQECERLQGFLFSRPIPADELTELLRQGLLNLRP